MGITLGTVTIHPSCGVYMAGPRCEGGEVTGADAVFLEHRTLLFTLAYEVVGTVVDAEDIVHEAYLRWIDVDQSAVLNPRNYLAQIVVRQALNHLRSQQRRREQYVGNWLPEPVSTGQGVDIDVELAGSVSVAMMVVLESLTPDERAVFVLHQVFGFALTEIATFTMKSESAVRQIARRSRAHVEARRRRFDPDPDRADQVVARFLASARSGDLQSLMDVLAPDVVQMSDGGGKVVAARRSITGAQAVAQFCIGVARKAPSLRMEFIRFNAMPAMASWDGETAYQVLVFDIAGDRIQGIYAIRNPEKLTNVSRVFNLSRS
jgi:RNA polymerase sigma factor (sigma-70 family)